jgi:O-antigen/teichoic acid export membrane protein
MSRSKLILKNTLSNVVIQIVSNVTAFILLPLLLKYFGKEVFGINAYIMSVTFMLDIFSYAISMSLMKAIPELIAKKLKDDFSSLIIGYIIISAILYFILSLILLAFAYFGLEWFNVPDDLYALTQIFLNW